MPLTVDPDIADALAPSAAKPAPEPHSWQDVRHTIETAFAGLVAAAPKHEVVTRTDYSVQTDDGATITARWYALPSSHPGSAVVHVHGGGMIAADIDLDDPYIADYVVSTGVPVLSVGYRLAPEVTGERMARDVFDALRWLVAHADDLKVDANRIAILGESGGGGIAAGTAILARDNAVHLAKQILIYPMLDDRTRTPDAQIAPSATWTYQDNSLAWDAILGPDAVEDNISPVCAPARLKDASGLPPAFIQVGEIDVFRNEDVAYAMKLWRDGVSAELSVVPGAVHGFDSFASDARVTRRAMAERYAAILAV